MAAGSSDGVTWWRRHPSLTYTGARLLLFLIPFLLLVTFLDPLVALVVAFVVSALVSIFALSGLRDAMSVNITNRADRANEKMAERAASEDAWDEMQRAEPDASGR